MEPEGCVSAFPELIVREPLSIPAADSIVTTPLSMCCEAPDSKVMEPPVDKDDSPLEMDIDASLL